MRASGILLGISSLPGKYGIGKMGKEAREFVDFLKESRQSYWQILPLSPTSYGDSPYQSCSTNAGNPYFIDFEDLEAQGLLTPEDYKTVNFGDNPNYIDYGVIYNTVFGVLRKAYARFKPNEDYCKFYEKNREWVADYALFMALKGENGGSAWCEWPEDLKMAKPYALQDAKARLADEIGFYVFMQYEFYKQWLSLKAYANENGVEIIGDMPIYCAYDSVEAWLHPELFELDEEKNPINVAGCPPDAFSEDGQLWGNPLYNWKGMQLTGYKWWIDRIAFATDIYDVLRIDHFRGFAGYYSIPFGEETARNGEWREGPKMELFNSTNYWLGKKRIIAEDLGLITPDVIQLLKDTEYPGMKVLQFSMSPDGKSEYLPCNYETTNCFCYTSTHDSYTMGGWVEELEGKELEFCMNYTGVTKKQDLLEAMLRLAWSSISEVAIAQPQDFLGYGNETRINSPGTVGLNWKWRISQEDLTEALSDKIKALTETYNRCGKQ